MLALLTNFGSSSVPRPTVLAVLPGEGLEWIGTSDWNCSSSSAGRFSIYMKIEGLPPPEPLHMGDHLLDFLAALARLVQPFASLAAAALRRWLNR